MPPKSTTQLQHTCGVCNTVVKPKSPSVLCTGCRVWMHSHCTGLSKTEFTKLASNINNNGLQWKCKSCIFEVSVFAGQESEDDDDDDDDNITMNKMKSLLENQYLKLTTTLEDKFDNFRSAIEKNVSDINKEVTALSKQSGRLNDKCTGLNQRLTAVENSLKSFSCTTAPAEDIIAEFSERKRRESNVIMLNVSESKKADGKERLNDDRANILNLLPPNLPANMDNFRLRRLGRLSAGRTRPLLVETPSPSTARAILKSKPPGPADGAAQVMFKADLTPAQQTHLKGLRAQLDTLVENGDSSKTIKYVSGVPKLVDKNFRSFSEKNKSVTHARTLPERERAPNKARMLPQIDISQHQ